MRHVTKEERPAARVAPAGARWLAALLFLLAAVPVLGQSVAAYDLAWSTVDGGGGTSSGAAYSLTGTAGQPDAGVVSGGAFTLAGGFAPGGVVAPLPQYQILMPAILRGW